MRQSYKGIIPNTNIVIEFNHYDFEDVFQFYDPDFSGWPILELHYDDVKKLTNIDPLIEAINGDEFIGIEAAEMAAIEIFKKEGTTSFFPYR